LGGWTILPHPQDPITMPLPDYETLIDAATWGFIRASEAAYPSDAVGLTMAQQRSAYDAMCAVFYAGRPTGILVRDMAIGGVPCRHYAGIGTTVVYLHGGGFVVGGLDSHDDICAEIAQATGFTVVSVDYRLSPEHLHPAAYDDTLAVVRAVQGRVVLVGDSAGANLAAAVAASVPVTGQVLVYPGLGGDRSKGSYLTHAQAPMLTLADVSFYAGIRHGGVDAFDDPTAAPLQAKDFTGLPPTVAFSAECDPLADDARDYVARIVAAGGQAEWVNEAGLVHGYLRARHSVPRANHSFARIVAAIAAFGQ
jgi:acetyl esterase